VTSNTRQTPDAGRSAVIDPKHDSFKNPPASVENFRGSIRLCCAAAALRGYGDDVARRQSQLSYSIAKRSDLLDVNAADDPSIRAKQNGEKWYASALQAGTGRSLAAVRPP
jgi:hypothetical protein